MPLKVLLAWPTYLTAAFIIAALTIPEDGRAAGNLFVARGGVVCDRESDIVKVRRAINTLRYFGQIRALRNAKRCQIYKKRQEIIQVLRSSETARTTPVQVKTLERPDEVRWMLSKDIRETPR